MSTATATSSSVSPSPFRSVPAGPVKPSLARYTSQSPATTSGALGASAWAVVCTTKLLPSPPLLPQPARATSSEAVTKRDAGDGAEDATFMCQCEGRVRGERARHDSEAERSIEKAPGLYR